MKLLIDQHYNNGMQHEQFEQLQLEHIQDDVREKELRCLFNLSKLGSRIGADARDESDNLYELKSTTRNTVSTARDLGPNHIERWKQRFWIVGQGTNYTNGFLFKDIYFLSRCHMQDWYDELTKRFKQDEELRGRVMDCARSVLTDNDIVRAGKLLYDGMLLNDPGLPWRYVREHGIKIVGDHANTLRRLVLEYPLLLPRPTSGIIRLGDQLL